MLWCLKKLVVARVRKGKLGRDVFCGKSKTLCLTNTEDRFITAPYKACQPQPPKLERQGLNPTQIPIHSSDLAFSPKVIFLQQKSDLWKMYCQFSSFLTKANRSLFRNYDFLIKYLWKSWIKKHKKWLSFLFKLKCQNHAKWIW